MRLSYRLGKHRTLSLAMLWQPDDYWPFMAGNVLLGAGYSVARVLLRSIAADMTDADNLESGSQRTGLFLAGLIEERSGVVVCRTVVGRKHDRERRMVYDCRDRAGGLLFNATARVRTAVAQCVRDRRGH
jgi:hypothetical protein